MCLNVFPYAVPIIHAYGKARVIEEPAEIRKTFELFMKQAKNPWKRHEE